MLPVSSEDVGVPTCNIVVQKDGEEEKVCGRSATMVTLVDPEETSKVLAVVLVCNEHDHALESGKALIAVSENGSERIGVQYQISQGGNETDDANAKSNDGG